MTAAIASAVVVLLVLLFVIIVIAKTAIVVPQQSAYVVERLGRYSGTIDAGFHILLPFVDVIRYRHSLKEAALEADAVILIDKPAVIARAKPYGSALAPEVKS